MVPCTLLRKLSFLIWYTALQFLVAYCLDALVLNTTMSLGLVAAATQTVWLMCTYLFVFALGVHTQFVSASQEEKLDEKTRESEARGGPSPAKKSDESMADHLMATALSILLVVMLANWFALFVSSTGTLYAGGDSMIRSLWGSPRAWLCVWVLFIMQTQLTASTYLMSMHYTQAVPLSTSLQMSVALYSVCQALLLLSLCARQYDAEATAVPDLPPNMTLPNMMLGNQQLMQPAPQRASGAERASQAESTDEAAEYVSRYWLENMKVVMLYIVAAICVTADFFVNALVLKQVFWSAEGAELPDKRYLKIGLLWISMFSALVILCMSDLGAYALVVLIPPMALVVFVSWHNYKTLEAPSFFANKPKSDLATRAKPSDAFNAAASAAATGSSRALSRAGPLPRLRATPVAKTPAVTADLVYRA